jgi:hypothetical protein
MSIFVGDWFLKETRMESKQYIIKILTSHSSLPFQLVSLQNKGLPSYRPIVSGEVRILWKLPNKALNKNSVRSLCLYRFHQKPAESISVRMSLSLSLTLRFKQEGGRISVAQWLRLSCDKRYAISVCHFWIFVNFIHHGVRISKYYFFKVKPLMFSFHTSVAQRGFNLSAPEFYI